jgi:hypothetical protein
VWAVDARATGKNVRKICSSRQCTSGDEGEQTNIRATVMMLYKLQSLKAVLLNFLKMEEKGTVQITSLEVEFFALQYVRRYLK